MLSAECTLAKHPDYTDMHDRCRQTKDVPLPHGRGCCSSAAVAAPVTRRSRARHDPRPHACRYREDLITDPEDAVLVRHAMGNSGPGWDVWAHRAHAHLVEPDPVAMRILARVLITRALRE